MADVTFLGCCSFLKQTTTKHENLLITGDVMFLSSCSSLKHTNKKHKNLLIMGDVIFLGCHSSLKQTTTKKIKTFWSQEMWHSLAVAVSKPDWVPARPEAKPEPRSPGSLGERRGLRGTKTPARPPATPGCELHRPHTAWNENKTNSKKPKRKWNLSRNSC